MRRTSLLVRKLYAALLVLFVLLGAEARAGDYTVSYAFDGKDSNEVGTARECSYDALCTIELRQIDLKVSMSLGRDGSGREQISISIHGGLSLGLGCCYFADGVNHLFFGFQPFVHLGVYEGRPRRRNEWVLNSYFGVLYLQFSDMK
jgi:hypothetical protein